MISDDTKSDIKTAATATKAAAQSAVRDGQMAAQDVVHSAADTVADAAQRVKDKAGEVAHGVKEKALDAAAVVADKADAASGVIADEGQRLARTLRSAASDRADTVQGRVLEAVAGGVESVSETIRDRSLSDIAADVKVYAQRHPGAFVAGAAVFGFMLARFLRAGERSS